MKPLRITLITLFVMAFLIISCKEKKMVPPINQKPDPIIKITGCDGDKLILSDGGKTTTTRANIVFWKIEDGVTCVKEIDSIFMKDIPNNVDVFDDGDPRKMNPNVSKSEWRGRIKPHLPLPGGNSVKYIYKIDWIDDLGNKHTYDPEIEVNE